MLKYFFRRRTQTVHLVSHFLIFHGSKAPLELGFLVVEVPRLHSNTPHSLWLLWTSDRPVAETSA